MIKHRRLLASCSAVLALTGIACGDSSNPDQLPTGGGGGSHAGGAAGGSGGSQTEPCVERIDSVVVGAGQGTTPFVARTNVGYAIAALRAGEAWLTLVDDAAALLSHEVLSNAAGLARLPSVHVVGDGLVALWAEGGNVMTRMLDASGAPLAPPSLIATTLSSEPRPAGASLGPALGTAWMEGTASTAGVLDAGTMLQTTPVPGWFPAVASSGGSLGVAWSEGGFGGPVHVARFDAMAAPVEIAASASLIKTLVGDGEAFYVSWEDIGGNTEQVGLAKVAADSSVAMVYGSESGSSANWPALAFDGERLALAYYQFRDGPPAVYLSYFERDLRYTGIELVVAENARYPAMAAGDGEIAVAYAVEQGPIELSVVRCR